MALVFDDRYQPREESAERCKGCLTSVLILPTSFLCLAPHGQGRIIRWSGRWSRMCCGGFGRRGGPATIRQTPIRSALRFIR